MLIKRMITVLLTFFWGFQALAKAEERAEDFRNFKEVGSVMNELFDYHVDHHKMTPTLLIRSLKVYFKQFDSSYEYLLDSEVRQIIELSDLETEQLLMAYFEDDFSIFDDISLVIQDSIERSRLWREELESDLDQLFQDAKVYRETLGTQDISRSWPITLKELRQRQRESLLSFIVDQLDQVGESEIAIKKHKIIELYERRMSENENNYFFIDEDGLGFTPEKREQWAALRILKALVKSLDSHSSYFSGQEAYDMRVQLEKGFQGIGVILQESVDGVVITRLIKGGPAEISGLVKEGDVIVAVDGEKITGYSFQKVLGLIRGTGNSLIKLGLKRLKIDDFQPEVIAIELIRGKVILDEKRVDVSYEKIDGGIIGKITLYSFYEGADGLSAEHDIREALKDLKEKGNLKGLALDLRDNMGGFLMQAVKVSGLFITSGVVVMAKYADGDVRYFRDIDGHTYYDGPMVVLTSKASASAAEIVAQALQDFGAAVIVGDGQTYGKGSIQHQTVTNEDSKNFFKVTVGRYYTVSGRSTQITGVESDIIVPTRYHEREIGESTLDYPLPGDKMLSSYKDILMDLDWESKRWYLKYYIPGLQKEDELWKSMLPVLRENSRERIKKSSDFQKFISNLSKSEAILDEDVAAFDEDLQMSEAVNILNDMIELEVDYALENNSTLVEGVP